jgi:glutamyl-tRNA synthetase
MVRTRFAPSPTGYLHIGGVRTALFNWLFARHHGGQFLLRIDDTDAGRNRPEALQPILDGFRWLGLTWDEGPEVGGPFGPYYQSEKLARHQEAVQQLIASGHAYYDYSTKAETDAERTAAEAAKRPYVYSRKWMAETPADRARFESEGRVASVRLKMPREDFCRFTDQIRGDVAFEWALEQDLVIQTSKGGCTYNLASVVDDYDMGITDVIRSEEHLSNTARQIFIGQSLGYPIPRYAHVPYVAAPGSKEKLSKRKLDKYLKNPEFKKLFDHGKAIADAIGLQTAADTFNPVIVDFYREVGYQPHAILNYLVLLGWSYDDKTEFFTREELIHDFSLERVNKGSASFDPKKLWAFQDFYMELLPLEKKTRMVLPYLQKARLLPHPAPPDQLARVSRIVEAAYNRIKTAGDILEYRDFFTPDDQLPYDDKAFDKHLRNAPDAGWLLKGFRDRLAAAPSFDQGALELLRNDYAQSEGITPEKFVQPIRVAVTGKAVSFGLFDVLSILGKEHCLARIDRALARLAAPQS